MADTRDGQRSAAARERWRDLPRRFGSAALLLAGGTAAIALGGVWFQICVVFATAVMLWELFRLLRPTSQVTAMLLAALTASVVSGLLVSPPPTALAMLLVPGLVGAAVLSRERGTFLVYATAIVAAGAGLVVLRDAHGAAWLFWLLLVVVVTDVLGYFAGRLIGGPKFWPSLSPKKTWAGIVAGWAGAGATGALFIAFTDAGGRFIVLSMIMSFASQMGDIAESALKRRAGVKDSSTLLPGHGGLLDRFDGLTGATLVAFACVQAGLLPGSAA